LRIEDFTFTVTIENKVTILIIYLNLHKILIQS